jgi:hypothetical protein
MTAHAIRERNSAAVSPGQTEPQTEIHRELRPVTNVVPTKLQPHVLAVNGGPAGAEQVLGALQVACIRRLVGMAHPQGWFCTAASKYSRTTHRAAAGTAR